MKLLQITLFIILGLTTISCQSKTKSEQRHEVIADLAENELQQYETAYFASGCFWCVEAIFESIKGVKEVVSGYSGGKEKDPTYEDVGYGRTTHAEAVEVYYDPKVVSFETLVKVFFGSHDPTTLNRQGPDKGAQYRSIAFYKNGSEKKIINDYISQLGKEKVYSAPIVTEVKPFSIFYRAEDYHQDYEKNHPNNSYILNVSIPRLKQFQAKFPQLLKEGTH
ncbi:MAG: peptide-methionine (S)-S-oxide reductase MsrA [Flavobacteriaceae bacterium]